MPFGSGGPHHSSAPEGRAVSIPSRPHTDLHGTAAGSCYMRRLSDTDYRSSSCPKRALFIRRTYDRCVFPSHDPVVDLKNFGKVSVKEPSSRMPETRTLRTSIAQPLPTSVSADSE